ncbi:MAG: energy transducer TonB [Sphingomonadales bacterium]|nr:MAG: energy transducer TonB [Sphingomonadales bacterium]
MILTSLFAAATLTVPTKLHCGRPPAPPNGAQWFTYKDYPKAARKAKMHGRIGYALHLSDEGCPTKCEIVSTSGYPLLDIETCKLLMRRARYSPALDAEGKPIASVVSLAITWALQ